MKTFIFCATLLLASSSFAKNFFFDVHAPQKKRASIRDARCKYWGHNTPTNNPGSTMDFDKDKVICDPLSGSTSASPDNGLLGHLILPNDSMNIKKTTSVLDYYNKGTVVDKNLYFASVNAPTQIFTKGFATENGDFLVDDNGNKLTENFAIEYTSSLQLGPNDKAGDYELALLSDDGSRLYVEENGTYNEIINNDGQHPTRMGCSSHTIHFEKNTVLPIKILYYQGPKNYIANVLIWKRDDRSNNWFNNFFGRSLCGYEGNTAFFNPKNGKDTAYMDYLQSTGWKTVASANFKMPENDPNVCAPPAPPALAISDFQLTSYDGVSATFTWTTNIPATSQLTMRDVDSGFGSTFPADAGLATEHSAVVSGLDESGNYEITVIARDKDGNTVTSAVLKIPPQ